MPADYAPAAITDGYRYLVDKHADMDGDGDYDAADRLSLGGVKGDAAHYAEGGYHVPARACGPGDYSTSMPADRGTGVDPYAASALDITPASQAAMRLATRRLIAAYDARDPRLYCVREFYGTTDGVNVVGRDLPSRTFASSDDSHLWHVHLSFFRRYANDAAAIRGVMDVLAGTPSAPRPAPSLLEQIIAINRNSPEYKALVADIADAVWNKRIPRKTLEGTVQNWPVSTYLASAYQEAQWARLAVEKVLAKLGLK